MVKIVVGDWDGDKQRVIVLKMAARKHMVIARAQENRHYVIGCHHVNINHCSCSNCNIMSIHAGIIIIMHMCTTVEACLKDTVLRHGLRIENNREHLITSPKGHLEC